MNFTDSSTTENLGVIDRLRAATRAIADRTWTARVPVIRRQLDEMRATAA